MHQIIREQVLPINLNDAWNFLSSPKNLAQITPKEMQFEQLHADYQSDKMYAGQLFEYYIRPVANLKMHWVTEITHVIPGSYFVDEQRFGPYTFWHHQHFLEPTAKGVKMIDIVHYKLPFGLLGKMMNRFYIANKLKQIFDYRFQKLNQLFPARN